MFSFHSGWQLVWITAGCILGPALIVVLAWIVTLVPRPPEASPRSPETGERARHAREFEPDASWIKPDERKSS